MGRALALLILLSAACGGGEAAADLPPLPPRADAPLRDDWMGAYLQGAKIGWSRTRIWADSPATSASRTRIENEARVEIDLAGSPQTLDLSFQGDFDSAQRPVDIRVRMAMTDQLTTVTGSSRGEEIDFVMTTPQTRATKTYRRDEVDFVGEDPLLRFALAPMKPGDRFTGRTVNPLGLELLPYAVEVARAERVKAGAGYETALVLVSELQGIRTVSWVLANGSTLRAEGPMGISFLLEAETVARDATRARGVDIALALSIPVRGRVPDDARRAVYLVTGLPREWNDLAGGVQRVLGRTGEATRIEVDLARAEGEAGPADLAATDAVASKDPRIAAASREAAGGASGRAAAERIHRWVYENVAKRISFTFPTALDVLATRSGDCNEHTVLYVALARAAGLPARIATGIAHQEGRFLYHAWPEVNWGQGWIPVEPTWGLFPAPAGRIRLAIGEASDQTRIGAVAGNLSIVVEAAE